MSIAASDLNFFRVIPANAGILVWLLRLQPPPWMPVCTGKTDCCIG